MMDRHTTWTLLLAAGLLGVAGTAVAQDDDDTLSADELLEDVDDDLELEDELFCDDLDVADGLSSLNDLHSRERLAESNSQNVTTDDDTILLAIALANNGADGIDWESVRSFDKTETRSMTASQTANLDREDVFSALALGINDDADALETLACVSDIESTVEQTETTSQDVDLDEDTVLLAIALSNSVGGELNFDDIASMDNSKEIETTRDRDVDVERNDAFLALALGNGGGD